MCSKARAKAFAAAKENPLGFLLQHFDLTPETDQESVKNKFAKFAGQTGIEARTAEAAAVAFIEKSEVPDFVLQAASGAKVDHYA